MVSSFSLTLSTTHLLSALGASAPDLDGPSFSAQQCPGGKALEKETMEVPDSHTGPAAFLQSVNLAGPPPPPTSGFLPKTSQKVVRVCSITQLCLTLCNSMDCSPPGSSVHGILRQTHWSGCHFFLQGILTQGSNPFLLHVLHWRADSLPVHHLGSPRSKTGQKKQL